MLFRSGIVSRGDELHDAKQAVGDPLCDVHERTAVEKVEVLPRHGADRPRARRRKISKPRAGARNDAARDEQTRIAGEDIEQRPREREANEPGDDADPELLAENGRAVAGGHDLAEPVEWRRRRERVAPRRQRRRRAGDVAAELRQRRHLRRELHRGDEHRLEKQKAAGNHRGDGRARGHDRGEEREAGEEKCVAAERGVGRENLSRGPFKKWDDGLLLHDNKTPLETTNRENYLK